VKVRLVSFVAVTALLVGVLAASAGASGNHPTRGAQGHAQIPRNFGLGVLYDQMNNDAGVGIVSQDFTDAGFDIYDSSGADDFTVPSGATWSVGAIGVGGIYFNGFGPGNYATVTIYADGGGLPGTVLATSTAVGKSNGGSFHAKIPGGVTLGAGTYWVSLQSNMAFSNGGEWGWETRSVQSGNAAVWQNPGDGFITGCTTWGNMVNCIGPSGEGPDFMFSVLGTSS